VQIVLKHHTVACDTTAINGMKL